MAGQLKEVAMESATIDRIQRLIDDEARERFPGTRRRSSHCCTTVTTR